MRAVVLGLASSNVEYELTCLDNLDWGQLEQLLWVILPATRQLAQF